MVRLLQLTVVSAITVLIAAAANAITVDAGGDARHPDYRHLSVTSRGLTAVATIGSYSTDNPDLHVLSAYPLPVNERLPIRPGGQVTIRTGEGVKKLRVDLRRRDSWPLKTLSKPKPNVGRNRWTVRLPSHLPARTRRLGIYLDAPDLEGDFEIGVCAASVCRNR